MFNQDNSYKADFYFMCGILVACLIFFTVVNDLHMKSSYNSGYQKGLIDGKIEMAEHVDSLVKDVDLKSVEVIHTKRGVTFNCNTTTRLKPVITCP